MKGIKNTLRLSITAIKLQPFFIVYSIISIVLQLGTLLFPIAIVQIIVGYYHNGEPFIKVVIACAFFALGYYLVNVTYFYLGKLYNRAYRNFKANYEIMIYNKLKDIDYDLYQSSSFLNDYTKALDEGGDACSNATWAVRNVIANILSVATVFTIFAMLNPIIILYAVIIGVIFFFIGKHNARLSWNLSEVQKQNYRERGYIRRMFYLKDSSEDIRTSPIKNVFLDINDEVGARVIRNTDKHLSKRAFFSFLAQFLAGSIYPFALFFLAYTTLQTRDFVSFTALTVAASSLSNYVLNLSDSLAYLETQSVQGEAIFRIIDKEGKIEKSGYLETSDFQQIKIENLNFGYQEKEVLKNINLTINKGDKIAIVGENGAGKTTLVKLLLRLYDPSVGSVYFNETNYQDIYPTSIRKRIGAVFQDFQVYSFTIAENVLLREPKTEEDEELVIYALKFSGLYDKVKKLEKGIHTIVTKEFDEKGVELSGGEKQKLAIARAFAGDYDLIILDEPSSALDPIAETAMYDKVMELGKDKTLIFISHRLSTTVRADQIYLFEKGEIVESGRHQELMNIHDGKYRYMFNIQAQKYLEGSKEA